MVAYLFRNWLFLVLAVAELVCGESYCAFADQHTAKIDDIFAAYDQPGSPGCTVAVLRRGDWVHRIAQYGRRPCDLGSELLRAACRTIGSRPVADAHHIEHLSDGLSVDDGIANGVAICMHD